MFISHHHFCLGVTSTIDTMMAVNISLLFSTHTVCGDYYFFIAKGFFLMFPLLTSILHQHYILF